MLEHFSRSRESASLKGQCQESFDPFFSILYFILEYLRKIEAIFENISAYHAIRGPDELVNETKGGDKNLVKRSL